jgi:hypothetical protein
MNAHEGLGLLGWVSLAVIALAAVVAVTTGFANTFYFAILLVPVVFVVLINLCAAKPDEA